MSDSIRSLCQNGVLFIGTVGSMVKSFQITLLDGSSFVTIIAVCNAISRILAGIAMDRLRNRITMLSAFFIPSMFLICSGFVVLLINQTDTALITATILIAWGYGSTFATLPVLVNYYFGDNNFGSNIGYLALGKAIGNLLLNLGSGALYDHFGTQLPSGEIVCYGSDCYIYTFYVNAGLTFITILIAIYMAIRERATKNRLHPKLTLDTPSINA